MTRSSRQRLEKLARRYDLQPQHFWPHELRFILLLLIVK